MVVGQPNSDPRVEGSNPVAQDVTRRKLWKKLNYMPEVATRLIEKLTKCPKWLHICWYD